MSATFETIHDGGGLQCRFEAETVLIEPWGRDSLRVRASRTGQIRGDTISALLSVEHATDGLVVDIATDVATVRNGAIEARVDRVGQALVPERPHRQGPARPSRPSTT